MEHTQPKHQALAIWNPVTDRWELEQVTIFGHSDAYSETWPTSGMTANGVAYELPTWEHHTAGTGYSSSQHDALLQTPLASEGTKPSNTMGVERRLSTGQVFLTNQIVTLCGLDPTEKLLPTPTTSEATGAGNGPNKTGGENLRTAVTLLPTPNTMDMLPAREGEAIERQLRQGSGRACEQENHDGEPTRGHLADSEPGRVQTNWGVYAPAIRRWEASRGTAPAPTELTPKGKHRLNAEFASWMMGLESGHVTGVPGITRNEQLKAIGNGVVPQQAIAALKHMLEVNHGA